MLLDVVYLLVVVLLLPWVAWRRLSGARPVAAPVTRFTGAIAPLPDPLGRPRIWLHGVSVGEVQLLAALAAEIGRQAEAAGHPVDCVVSSSTTTGLEVACKRFGAERVFPCPLDFSWAVERVLDRVAPGLIVLGELELWPNLLARAGRRGIPVVVANARMSPRSAAGYGRVAPLVRRMLSRVAVVAARSAEDGARFSALGAERVVVVGSLKYDGVRGDRDHPEIHRLRSLAGFAADDVVFVAGSTQAPEEELALATYRTLRPHHPRLRLVIVPRHVERSPAIAAMLDRSAVDWRRRGESNTGRALPSAPVLLVDTTGELAWWWGIATVAFVGGSLDGQRGGQNMLEPAAYGAAVCFGPHTRNFAAEVATLLAAEAATVVADGEALTAFVRHCLDDPTWAAGQGGRARATIETHRGATAVTAALILDNHPACWAARARCRPPENRP